MQTIHEDDGSPPVHAIGNRERERIAQESMRWALPKGLVGAGICSGLAIMGATFASGPQDTPLVLVVAFYFVIWPLGLFIWKRKQLRQKVQSGIDALNRIEREVWQNKNKTRSTGSAEKQK